MLYDEYVEFDVRLTEKLREDEEYNKKYIEYLKKLEDYSYNVQEVEI